jgi:hypothetical protein
MAMAPAAAAAFPEDFVITQGDESSSSSSASSVSSAGTGSAVLSASSASSEASSAPVADDEEQKEEAEDGIGEAARLAAQQQLTRAEFTALIVEKLYTQAELERCYWDIASSIPPRFTLVFTDVHVNDRFAKHICVAMRNGLVRGQGDGSFRPNQKITFAESAKIIARAFVLTPYADANRLEPWYREYTMALDERNAIPMSIDRMDHLVTGAEAADMFNRLSLGITSLPSRTYNDLQPPVRKPVPSVKPKPAASQKPAPGATSSVSSQQTSSAAMSSESSSSKKPFWNPF